MRKVVTLLFSSMALLNLSLLTAQPAYPTSPNSGYPSIPNNSNYYPQSGNQQTSSYASNQVQWLRSYSEAVALSQSTSKPIVILFTGTGWCPACMKLERMVVSRPEFAQAVGQKFVFLKAEFPDYSEPAVMASPYKPLLDRYGINEFPTMVIINTNGQELYRVKYKEGGPQVYAQELLQKLDQMRNASSYSPS